MLQLQCGVEQCRFHNNLECDEHRWAIAPQSIEQLRIVLSILKVSAPGIRRDISSMAMNDTVHAGLCIAIRWRTRIARQESLPESMPSPTETAATAHVKVTLKTDKNAKGDVKGAAEKEKQKGGECNSGSHIGSMGGPDTRIGSLPAGAAGTGNSGACVP